MISIEISYLFHCRTIPGDCESVKAKLIDQMNLWQGDSNCGQVSDTCPSLPCGQNCLYEVCKSLPIFMILYLIAYRYLIVSSTQHDELKSNLKKILHTNGIWGLEAIVMYFHLPISKKSVSIAPVRKITKPRFRK